MTNHGRTSALVIALAAVFALALSGSALAAHDLKIYKVEKQVDLISDDTGVDLSCNSGDIATDGMWRIDHADQDNDELGNVSFLAQSVDVTEAYPTDIDSYHFRFLKNAIGRAQAKVFLTCLGKKTFSADSHTHNVQIAPIATAGWAPNWTVGGQSGYTFAAGTATMTTGSICPANSYVAQPGFKITPSGGPSADPVQYTGRLNESDPVAGMNGWKWAVDLSPDPTATIDYYAMCIKQKVSTAAGESHKLVYRFQSQANTVHSGDTTTLRITCHDTYKAIVAGFRFTYGDLFYLGMDPQPKSRNFKFLNPTGGDSNVTLAAICLNYRTT